MTTKLAFPKKLFVVTLSLFVIGVLFLTLFFYFRGAGAYGGVFLKNDLSFTLRGKEGEVYLSPEESKTLIENENLKLENNEKERLTFIFYQEGEKAGEFTLAGKDEKKLPFSFASDRVSLLVKGEKKEVAYLSDRASFLAIAEEMKQGGDLVFLKETSLLKAYLSAPFRFFGHFSFEELSFETKEKGNIVFCPEKEQEGEVFVSAPGCRVYAKKLSLLDEKEYHSFYFQAKSFNGKKIKQNQFPISSFENLERLASESLLPKPNEGAELIFTKEFSLKESLRFDKPLSLTFEKQVDFDSNSLSFVTEKKGAFRVKTAPGVNVYASDLCFSAPKCTLLWEGEIIPKKELVEKQSNLSTYNGKSLSLGGEGTAVPTLVFEKEKNAALSRDLIFSPKGNLLVGTIPFTLSEKELDKMTPTISCENGSATLAGLLSSGVIVTRDEEGREKRFAISVEREGYNIPVVSIETDSGGEIESKTQYMSATFSMTEGRGIPGQKETSIRIRGRGNSTWKWDKKPYKIHFDTPTSLLGLPEAEEWALFANYADKSLMRNRLAQEMAKTLSFDYCPSQVYVDLFVNGEYQGVYTLGEHLEAGEGRVEVGYQPKKKDCGFFLEAGGTTAGVDVKGMNYFHADLIKFVLIKSPDYRTMTSEQFDYIKSYMTNLSKAVQKGEGYEEYVDMETLVDWMIMIELSCNTDCSWRRSTFFTKNPGEKVKMGPVWDFDLAFGNFSKDNDGYDTFVSTEPEDDYIGETLSTYLLEDPRFRARFKARWEEKRDELLVAAFTMIEEDYEVLFPSAVENFNRWDVLGKKVAFERHDTVDYPTYDSQITYLKNFLLDRAAWLDGQVENW